MEAASLERLRTTRRQLHGTPQKAGLWTQEEDQQAGVGVREQVSGCGSESAERRGRRGWRSDSA